MRTNLAHQIFGAVPRPNLNTASQEEPETITAGEGEFATLDLGPLTTNIDTVLQATSAGAGGNAITLTFVHDAGAAATGTLTRVGNDFTYTYLGGTTTVANFEADVAALAGADDLIEVLTPGAADTLADTVDEFSAEAFTGGTSLMARTIPVDGKHGHWSLHLLVTGTPTGTVTFYYSNLPYPDINDADHWVLDSSKSVTLSGAASRTFTTGVDKVSDHIKVLITLTDGSGSACGWATTGGF